MTWLAQLGRLIRGNGRAFAAGIIIGFAIIGGGAAIVLPPWLLTHRSNLPGEAAFGDVAVSLAAMLHAGSSASPVQASDRGVIERGQYAYTGSCAQCHGPAGDGKNGALSKALFPPATDLTSGDAKEKSDATLFWITKQGLSFTAMPGFAGQYNDQTIWAIVAYMRALQNGPAKALVIPTPTDGQLAQANIAGDAVARGAAVYFAQGCEACHGGSGNGPGELRLRAISTNDAQLSCVLRNGPNGMPGYDTATMTDAQLRDLIAFLRTLAPPEQPRVPRAGATPAAGAPQGTPSPRPTGGDRQSYSSPASAQPGFAGCSGLG